MLYIVISAGTSVIGSVRKNSGGKRQAWYQSHVVTDKRRSLSALVRYLGGQTHRRQRRKWPAFTCDYL